jgi:hypothetical protein
VTSSKSGTGSDWFEDWPEPNDMTASAYIVLTTEPSPRCRDSDEAPRRSCGRLCARPLEGSSVSTGGSRNRKSVGAKELSCYGHVFFSFEICISFAFMNVEPLFALGSSFLLKHVLALLL